MRAITSKVEVRAADVEVGDVIYADKHSGGRWREVLDVFAHRRDFAAQYGEDSPALKTADSPVAIHDLADRTHEWNDYLSPRIAEAFEWEGEYVVLNVLMTESSNAAEIENRYLIAHKDHLYLAQHRVPIKKEDA